MIRECPVYELNLSPVPTKGKGDEGELDPAIITTLLGGQQREIAN
jgi:hypothetical protein